MHLSACLHVHMCVLLARQSFITSLRLAVPPPPPPHPICPNSPRSPSVPRYQLIKRLFNIPGAFLAELLVQEPALLGMSSALLQAKFDTLVQRCVGGLRLLQ
jgi:hypothetical protein